MEEILRPHRPHESQNNWHSLARLTKITVGLNPSVSDLDRRLNPRNARINYYCKDRNHDRPTDVVRGPCCLMCLGGIR